MYDRFVKQVPPNSLEGITQRLDFIGPKMIEMAERIEKMETAVSDEVIIEQVSFAYNLAALQGVLLTEIASFTGHIKLVIIHWPDGCDALVNVRVGRGVEQFCPREGFLSLNDATMDYKFNIPVKEGEEIWVEIRNTDGVNPHNITVTISLEGR